MINSAASLNVLLIDDDDLIRRAGKALLDMLGHHVTLANDGPQALELLRAQEFDAVLLDMTMPVMNGKDVFLEIHRQWPDLPVAICTGYHVDVDQWASSSPATVPHVLSKPYSVEDLSQFLSLATQRK